MEQPKYPKESNGSRAQGEVTVVVLIGENGSVLDAKVQQGSGSSALDQAAVSGIKKWKYPVRKNQGRCVTSQPLVFSIAD
jgi:protein TonB